jgi:hypothetical protein
MGSFYNGFENSLLDHICQNANVANVGDATGLRGSSTAGVLYFSGQTAWPGETGDQSTNECTYTGYLNSPRASVARSSAGFNAAVSGGVSLVNPLSFGKRTDNGAVQSIMFVTVGTSSSGAGTPLFWAAIGDAVFGARPFVVQDTTAETIRVAGHGLATDDRIAFFQFEAFPDLPGGLTEGTVYFVRSSGLTTDDFTISTSSGGAAVNLTGMGSGIAVKIRPIPVTQNIDPNLQANVLIRLE